VTRLGTRSLTVRQELVQDDEVAIRASAVMVLFDFATDTSRAMTDDERAHWSRFAEG
jgi:acyl-CoA thioester hydrolase